MKISELDTAALFDFDDVPYSAEADAVGYSSRYIILNSGSVPVYIVILTAMQLVFSIIARVFKPGMVIHRFAVAKKNSFRWAGMIDFFNEINIGMSFSMCINISVLRQFAETPSLAFNNVFSCSFPLKMENSQVN